MTLAVMLQGTASDVGKSVLVAGLCRIFHQDGLRTAPFKSQNMALNSGITPDGKEMGRAQIFQAEAAGIAPDVRMNPVLLKPTSDRQAQVVLMGQVATSMDAVSYHQYKPRLREQILAVYQSLAGEYEALVLEGAGSPAEINLRDRDIVNMGMAEMAQCPVILVADIDRGGVFAAIYGTLALLQPQERARVKGVIINKFRGDVALLRSGIEQIEALTGVPVLGVMPWLDVDLEDEDGVALQAGKYHRTDRRDIDIAVVHLPHIANFTDFNALAAQPDVRVRYVRDPQALADADLVILPGSKNTLGDLCWLRESGMAHTQPGLGVLKTVTHFAQHKTTTQVQATLGTNLPEWLADAAGLHVSGYEIHMGETRREAGSPPLLQLHKAGQSVEDGAISDDGLAFGTYLHGLFDSDAFTRALLNGLRRQFDRLADAMREHIAIDKIYAIMRQHQEPLC
ncbi:MAG: cobyric acid synthase [Klebsiella sp.]|nr:cobyric acid synthase [Klebsiella sp.]